MVGLRGDSKRKARNTATSKESSDVESHHGALLAYPPRNEDHIPVRQAQIPGRVSQLEMDSLSLPTSSIFSSSPPPTGIFDDNDPQSAPGALASSFPAQQNYRQRQQLLHHPHQSITGSTESSRDRGLSDLSATHHQLQELSSLSDEHSKAEDASMDNHHMRLKDESSPSTKRRSSQDQGLKKISGRRKMMREISIGATAAILALQEVSTRRLSAPDDTTTLEPESAHTAPDDHGLREERQGPNKRRGRVRPAPVRGSTTAHNRVDSSFTVRQPPQDNPDKGYTTTLASENPSIFLSATIGRETVQDREDSACFQIDHAPTDGALDTSKTRPPAGYNNKRKERDEEIVPSNIKQRSSSSQRKHSTVAVTVTVNRMSPENSSIEKRVPKNAARPCTKDYRNLPPETEDLLVVDKPMMARAGETGVVDLKIQTHHGEQWMSRYRELLMYRNKHGDCNVPFRYTQKLFLAQWVKRQRHQYKCKMKGKHSHLTEERRKLLEDAGFVWDSHDVAWEENFSAMLNFWKKKKSCQVPVREKQLSAWAKRQRRHYKLWANGEQSTLTDDRVRRLSEINFLWQGSGLVSKGELREGEEGTAGVEEDVDEPEEDDEDDACDE